MTDRRDRHPETIDVSSMSPRQPHPGKELLLRFLRGQASRPERLAVVRHLLAGCRECVAVTRPVLELADEQRKGGRQSTMIKRATAGVLLFLFLPLGAPSPGQSLPGYDTEGNDQTSEELYAASEARRRARQPFEKWRKTAYFRVAKEDPFWDDVVNPASEQEPAAGPEGGRKVSEEVDLHIAIEHGLMAQAGVLLVSASPLSEEVFRRVQARIRRDADIAAHYARRYLESGAPVPRRSFFEVLETLLQERQADQASGAGAEQILRKAPMPWPVPNVLPPSREEMFPAASAAEEGSAHGMTGAMQLVTRGLHMFLQWRVDPLAGHAVSRGSAP